MWRILLGLISFWMSFRVTPKKITDYLESKGVGTKNNLEFVTPETVRVCAVQLKCRSYENLRDFLDEMLRLTKEAVENGAQMVVFPEYIGLAPLTVVPGIRRMLGHLVQTGDLKDLDRLTLDSKWMKWLAEAFHHFIYETYVYTFGTIARLQRVYIVAGTTLLYEQGELTNSSVVFAPDGSTVGVQGKTSSIGLDRQLEVEPSSVIEVMDTPMGKLSVMIGSDVYYFENFRIAKAHGAQIIAVPDSKGGVLCNLLRCRADEQQMYAVYSCYAGLSSNTRAGIFCPLQAGPRRSGITAVADSTDTAVVAARINMTKLDTGVNLEAGEPNFEFLQGDYLHSYCYCGALPIMEVTQEDIPAVIAAP